MPTLRIIHPSCTLLVFCLLLAPGALEAQPSGGLLKIDLGDTPVALAAFNGNAGWNLAVANLGSISLLRVGNDGVTISNPALPSIPAGFFLRSIITGNFGGSGGQDLALVGDLVAGAFVLLGHQNQPFSTGFQSAPFTLLGYSIVTADFNGDGIPDLAIAGAPFQPPHHNFFDSLGFTCSEDFHFTCFPAVQVLLGTGTGDFVTTVPGCMLTISPLPPGPNPCSGSSNLINSELASGLSLTGNDSPYALVAGDFNGDGKIDLAVTNPAANTVVIMLGNGDGTFGGMVAGLGLPGNGLGTRTTVPVGSNPLGIAAGDFNHDGKLDLAVANTLDNTVTVLLGDGKGNFAPTRDSPLSVGSGPQAIAIVDIDGNGSVDLATANYADGVHGTVSVLRGRHDGTFRRQSDIPVGGGPVALTAGNFGDHPGDSHSPQPHVGRSLAVANNAGYVTILFDLSGQGGNAQGGNGQ